MKMVRSVRRKVIWNALWQLSAFFMERQESRLNN